LLRSERMSRCPKMLVLLLLHFGASRWISTMGNSMPTWVWMG
jgi:hypothetical protein